MATVRKTHCHRKLSTDSIRQFADELDARNDPDEIEAANLALWDVRMDSATRRGRAKMPQGRRDSGVVSPDVALLIASETWRMPE